MPWTQIGNIMGPEGPPGEGIAIRGSVATWADLDQLPGPHVNGDVWITEDTGHGWVVDNSLAPGSIWVDIGPIRGPEGPPGLDGQDGADGADGQDGQDGVDGVRGTRWDTGTVDPTTIAGELPNDLYLNTANGDVWVFS